jgi:hypothetical protein
MHLDIHETEVEMDSRLKFRVENGFILLELPEIGQRAMVVVSLEVQDAEKKSYFFFLGDIIQRFEKEFFRRIEPLKMAIDLEEFDPGFGQSRGGTDELIVDLDSVERFAIIHVRSGLLQQSIQRRFVHDCAEK